MTGDAADEARLALAIEALQIDRVTGEVVEAFRGAGIHSILLKGPAIARWLYADGSPRPYIDTDLLVPPDEHAGAVDALVELGFELELGDEDTPGWRMNAHEWRRPDGARIDLHRTLVGVGVGPERLWPVLAEQSEPIWVGGVKIDSLSGPGRALHVALHAAQHGAWRPQALEDLGRALGATPLDTWAEAAILARELDAVPAFAAGLRLDARGAEVAARLELSERGSREVTLRAATPPPGALGLEELAHATGLAAKLKLIGRNLVPSPRFMRVWSPLARRGRLGLAAAYLWRPVAILLRAGPALIAWLRARKQSRGLPRRAE
jgi:Uncharacterised nucleotidyltransferase